MSNVVSALRHPSHGWGVACRGSFDDVVPQGNSRVGTIAFDLDDRGLAMPPGALELAWPGSAATDSAIANESVRGLSGKGDPLGAFDVAQCVELLRQLRDTAADDADRTWIALAHNTDGPTAHSAAMILRGPEANGG